MPIAPPAIPGIGTTGGFEFWIQDTAAGSAVELATRCRPSWPRRGSAASWPALNTTFNANTQQLRADVDREKAMLLHVPVQDVYSAIQAQFGSLTASQFSQYSRVWWVIVQSDAPFRQQPGDLTRLYTRSNQGKMVPLSAVVTHELDGRAGPAAALQRLPGGQDHRQRRRRLQLGPGDRDDGRAGARAAAATYTFAWSGLAFEEKSRRHLVAGLRLRPDDRLPGAGGAVRDLDAARRGDDGHPLRRARRAARNYIRGLENDVYFQIGLLVLIGLGAKNAVLRVSARRWTSASRATASWRPRAWPASSACGRSS